jgi:hypothetical protein
LLSLSLAAATMAAYKAHDTKVANAPVSQVVARKV